MPSMPDANQAMAKKVESMIEIYRKRYTKERLGDRMCDFCGEVIFEGDEFAFIYTNHQKPIRSACKHCADGIEVSK